MAASVDIEAALMGLISLDRERESPRKIHAPPPDSDELTVENLRRALESLEGDGVILLGSLLLLRSEGVLSAHALNQWQVAHLTSNPHLLSDVHGLLADIDLRTGAAFLVSSHDDALSSATAMSRPSFDRLKQMKKVRRVAINHIRQGDYRAAERLGHALAAVGDPSVLNRLTRRRARQQRSVWRSLINGFSRALTPAPAPRRHRGGLAELPAPERIIARLGAAYTTLRGVTPYSESHEDQQ